MKLSRSYLPMFFGCLLASLFWTYPQACLWFYGTSLNGRRIEVSGEPDMYVSQLREHQKTPAQWLKLSDELAKKAQKSNDFHDRSDYAATLMHLNAAAQAIEIFEEIEQAHPGEYVTAANLGTGFELTGKNNEARHWIAEGIRRNKDSHYGTEWIHLNILDAKIAMKENPDWLKTHNILGLDFGSKAVPTKPEETIDIGGAKKPVIDIGSAIYYQLHERIGFVPAPDPIVADLLFDLGNIAVFTLTLEHAVKVYELALTYKPTHETLVRERMAHCQTVIDQRMKGIPASASNAPAPSSPAAIAPAPIVESTGSGKRRAAVALSVLTILLSGMVGWLVIKNSQNPPRRSRKLGGQNPLHS